MIALTELKNLFRKFPTIDYDKQPAVSPEARGIPVTIRECRKCRDCVDICPTSAIKIRGSQMEFDYGNCLQCGLCALICQEGAIRD